MPEMPRMDPDTFASSTVMRRLPLIVIVIVAILGAIFPSITYSIQFGGGHE